MSEKSSKPFDCVEFMREARDRISREIEHMNHDELENWFRSREYTDPTLKRISTLFRQTDKAS